MAKSIKNFLIDSFRKYSRHMIAATLLLLTVSVYSPVKDHSFIIFDDSTYVTTNTHVQSGINLESIQWAFTTVKTDEIAYWHPLTWLSHMLDCQLFGLAPGMHHLSNLAFHLLNVALLYYLLVIMTGGVWESLLAAALFALHPINVDSVAWVAERKNLLSTAFWFITMMAYVYYARRPSVQRYILIIIAFSLGLMAKPMLVTLPCVLLLMDYWPLYRLQWGQRQLERIHDSAKHFEGLAFQPASLVRLMMEKLPLLALSIGAIALSVISLQSYDQMIKTTEVPFPLRLSNAIVSYGVYLRKMIWPSDLACFYPFPASMPIMKTVSIAICLIIVTGFFLCRARKSPYLITGWFWYLGTLTPVIGLVQGGVWPAIADRWAYVPLIGIFFTITWEVSTLVKSISTKTGRLILSTSAALILLLLWIQTGRQLGYWKNDETLFRHAIEVTDKNFVAHNGLGAFYAKAGDTALAMQHFTRALDIKPDDFRAAKNFALFLTKYGDSDQALNLLGKALQSAPRDNELVVAMGDAYLRKDEPDKAIHYYSQALLAQPGLASIHNNIGNAYLKKGNVKQAIHAYEQAESLKPDDPDAYFNLGLVQARLGNIEEALRFYRTALAHDPDYLKAHQKIAEIMFQQNRVDEALKHYQEALRIAPKDEKNYYNIGVLLIMKGRTAEAVSHFEKALEINPEYRQARIALDQVVSRTGVPQ